VRAFEYFGGVPRRIAYDNLKCAVIKVGKGKSRRINKRFKELRAWYLFETRCWNVAKGNEKGDVENGCKRSENTYLSPATHVDGIGQVAGKLFDDWRNDLQRKGPDVHGGNPVGELLEEERPYLLALQAERFAACRRRSTFVDSHAVVRVDTVRYSVPVEWAYHPCVIEAFVKFFCSTTRPLRSGAAANLAVAQRLRLVFTRRFWWCAPWCVFLLLVCAGFVLARAGGGLGGSPGFLLNIGC